MIPRFRPRVKEFITRPARLHAMRVPLGAKSIDDLLGGGFEGGCITLLYGEAGSRETNLCLQLAPNVATSQLYTDIETGRFLPLGGHMLTHSAKTIVERSKTGPSARVARLVKHRSAEEGRGAKFRLTGAGVEG